VCYNGRQNLAEGRARQGGTFLKPSGGAGRPEGAKMSLDFSPPDGLIVLGASLNPRDEPGRVARTRLAHALNLWRHHLPQGYLLLTGGLREGKRCSEARAMADWAFSYVSEQWGAEVQEVLRSCLILEEASRSTAASARHTLPLVQERGSRRVGLVTDALHIHRAHLLFRRQFHPQGITVIPFPARGLARQYWQHRRYRWLTKMALREGGAWLKVLGRLLLRRP
jgi:uncharacterized SAM-binding protein YcdF (DUF218 family)